MSEVQKKSEKQSEVQTKSEEQSEVQKKSEAQSEEKPEFASKSEEELESGSENLSAHRAVVHRASTGRCQSRHSLYSAHGEKCKATEFVGNTVYLLSVDQFCVVLQYVSQ